MNGVQGDHLVPADLLAADFHGYGEHETSAEARCGHEAEVLV